MEGERPLSRSGGEELTSVVLCALLSNQNTGKYNNTTKCQNNYDYKLIIVLHNKYGSLCYERSSQMSNSTGLAKTSLQDRRRPWQSQKCISQGIGRQGIVLKHRSSLLKEPMPCRHMPLLVQL